MSSSDAETVTGIARRKMTGPHPRDLVVERNPFVLLGAVLNIVRDLQHFLGGGEEWQQALADDRLRLTAWEQITFAQLVLDRLRVVLLQELDDTGWQEKKTDERVLPL